MVPSNSAPMDKELDERLAVLYLNGLVEVPESLLVARLDDIRDGRVITEIVNLIRRRIEGYHDNQGHPRPFSRLEDALYWCWSYLDNAFTTHGTPQRLASLVTAGNREATLELIHALQGALSFASSSGGNIASRLLPAGNDSLNFTAAIGDVSLLSGASFAAPPSGGLQRSTGALHMVQHSAPSATAQPALLSPQKAAPAPAQPKAIAGGTRAANDDDQRSVLSGPVPVRGVSALLRSDASEYTNASSLQAVTTMDHGLMDITALGGSDCDSGSDTSWRGAQSRREQAMVLQTSGAVPAACRRGSVGAASAVGSLAGSVALLTHARTLLQQSGVSQSTQQGVPAQWNTSTAVEQPTRPKSAVHARATDTVVQAPSGQTYTKASGHDFLASAGPAFSPRTPTPTSQRVRRVSSAPSLAASALGASSVSAGGGGSGTGLLVGGIFDPSYRPRVMVADMPSAQLRGSAQGYETDSTGVHRAIEGTRVRAGEPYRDSDLSRELAAAAAMLDGLRPPGTAAAHEFSVTPSRPSGQAGGVFPSSAAAGPARTDRQSPYQQSIAAARADAHAATGHVSHDARMGASSRRGSTASTAAPPPAQPVGPDGLTPRQRSAVEWASKLGVELDSAKRMAAGLGGGGAPPAGQASRGIVDALPRLVEDGVLLCELIAAAETRAGSRLPTVAVELAKPAGTHGSTTASGSARRSSPPTAGNGSAYVRVLPGTTVPRPGFSLSAAASSRNMEIALSLLRERPRVSPRHLYSPTEILHASRNPALAWGLLEDIYRGYRALTDPGSAQSPSPTKALQQQQQQPPPSLPQKQHQQEIQPTLPRVLQPPTRAATVTLRRASAVSPAAPGLPGSVDDQRQQRDSHSVTAAAQSYQLTAVTPASAQQQPSTPARTNAAAPAYNAAVGTPRAPMPLSSASSHAAAPPSPGVAIRASVPQQQQRRDVSRAPPHDAAGAAHARKLKPVARPVVPPQGVPPPVPPPSLGAPGALRRRDAAGASALRDEVSSFLSSIGLASLAAALTSGSAGHSSLLDSPLFNGSALAELAETLEPDSPPLGGQADGRLARHTAPKTLAEARANVEAALSVLRRSPNAQCVIPQLSPLRYLPGEASSAEASRVPQGYLWATEAILQGDEGVAWGLLWHVSRAYSWTAGRGLYILPGHQPGAAVSGPEAPEPVSSAAQPGQPPAAPLPARRSSITSTAPSVAYDTYLRSMERDVCGWLAESGVISGSSTATTIDALLPAITNGTLLVAVAERCTGQPRLPGTSRKPASDIAARGNIRRAVEALRGLPSVSSRALHSPGILQSLRAGSRLDVVNILHDVMEWEKLRMPASDAATDALLASGRLVEPAGLAAGASTKPPTAPRSRSASVSSQAVPQRRGDQDVPQAAVTAARPATASTPLPEHTNVSTLVGGGSLMGELRALMAQFQGDEPQFQRDESGATRSGDAALHEGARGNTHVVASAALHDPAPPAGASDVHVYFDAPSVPVEDAFHTHHPAVLDADTGATRNVPAISAIELLAMDESFTAPNEAPPSGAIPLGDSVAPTSWVPLTLSSSAKSAAALQHPLLPHAPAPQAGPHESTRRRTHVPTPVADLLTGEAPAGARAQPPVALAQHYPPQAQPAVLSSAAEAQAAAAWLASLGLGDAASLAAELMPRSSYAASFTDGTLLASVVQHCEDRAGLRRAIVGLDKAPKTSAARLGNMRRVLEVLRLHRSMPLTHLWSELDLLEGDPSVTRSLLLQMRKAYGLHHAHAGIAGPSTA